MTLFVSRGLEELCAKVMSSVSSVCLSVPTRTLVQGPSPAILVQSPDATIPVWIYYPELIIPVHGPETANCLGPQPPHSPTCYNLFNLDSIVQVPPQKCSNLFTVNFNVQSPTPPKGITTPSGSVSGQC